MFRYSTSCPDPQEGADRQKYPTQEIRHGKVERTCITDVLDRGILVQDLCNASRCQPVPVVAPHSHSIVNRLQKASNGTGFPVVITVDIMKTA